MPDIIQRRAQHAWTKVNEAKHNERIDEGKYQTWAQKLPSLISQCGILPTLAFLQAKKGEQASVGEACAEWLLNANGGAALVPWTREQDDIISRLMNEDSRVYRAAQAEAIRWAIWLKRFAEGYLEDVGASSPTAHA